MSRSAREFEVTVSGGVLAGIDYSTGSDDDLPNRASASAGPPVLLVHGTGQNAAAWNQVAEHLVGQVRGQVAAVDLRGHGQSTAASQDAERYWRDLADVRDALGWAAPVLVGHSTGGYAVTAVTAAELIEPAAVCVVDGFVLDDRATATEQLAAAREPDALEHLRSAMQYGWTGTDRQMRDLVESWCTGASDDWLNAGADISLVECVALRSMVRQATRGQSGTWLRRPTLQEISTVTDPGPNAHVFPSVEVYDQLRVPTTMVLATAGLYADRRHELASVVAARPNRRMVEIVSNHNVPMTQPHALSRVIAAVIADLNDL